MPLRRKLTAATAARSVSASGWFDVLALQVGIPDHVANEAEFEGWTLDMAEQLEVPREVSVAFW